MYITPCPISSPRSSDPPPSSAAASPFFLSSLVLGGFPGPAHPAGILPAPVAPPPLSLSLSLSCVEIRSALAGESTGIPFPPRRRQVPGLEISVFHIQDFPSRPFLPPFAALPLPAACARAHLSVVDFSQS